MSYSKKINLLRETFGSCYSSNKEHLFSCPFCKHHKKKLSVNISKNKWKCWVCGKAGNKITSLFHKTGEFSAKAKWISLVGGVDFSSINDIMKQTLFASEEKEKIELPKEFQTLTGKPTITSIEPRNYLSSRGLSQLDVAWWKMGFCWSGEYADRIVIPSFDKDGELNYFVARAFNNEAFPKYKNPPVPKDIVFNELYLDKNKDLIVVEGVFDAIIAHNAVPLLGSTLRDNSYVLDFLASCNGDIYFALDYDARKRENKIMKLLLTYDKRCYKIEVPPERDVGEMTKKEFLQRKENAYLVKPELLLVEAFMERK